MLRSERASTWFLRILAAACQAHGLEPAALALRFVDSRPFVTSTLIGATTMAQLRADIDAFDLPWTPDLDAEADRLHNLQPNPCP